MLLLMKSFVFPYLIPSHFMSLIHVTNFNSLWPSCFVNIYYHEKFYLKNMFFSYLDEKIS